MDDAVQPWSSSRYKTNKATLNLYDDAHPDLELVMKRKHSSSSDRYKIRFVTHLLSLCIDAIQNVKPLPTPHIFTRVGAWE